jgi:hypothetical protein
MSKKLEALLKAARNVIMTAEEHEQQRRSFAFGNANIENERVTRETIDRAARLLAEDKSE